MADFSHSTWYYGAIDREKAEQALEAIGTSGSFLIRWSDERSSLVLSSKHGGGSGYFHCRVMSDDFGNYQLQGSDKIFGDLNKLVDYYHMHGVPCGKSSIVPTRFNLS